MSTGVVLWLLGTLSCCSPGPWNKRDQKTIDLEFRISDGKMEIEDVLIRRANVLLWGSWWVEQLDLLRTNVVIGSRLLWTVEGQV